MQRRNLPLVVVLVVAAAVIPPICFEAAKQNIATKVVLSLMATPTSTIASKRQSFGRGHNVR